MRTRILLMSVVAALALSPSAWAAKATRAASASKPAASLIDADLYRIDAAHSSVAFAVQYLGLSKVRGNFTDFSGTIGLRGDDPARSSATVVIKTGSLTTYNERRDKHLKTADFFDVEKYPTIAFTSQRVEKTADGFVLHGSLSLHGATQPVDISFTPAGRVQNANGTRVAFEGSFSLNRKDFGIVGPERFNIPVDLGGTIIADKVDVQLEMQGVLSNLAAMPEPAADSLVMVREPVLNLLGLRLLQEGRPKDALEVFKLQAEFYPQSAQAFTGLGNAYAAMGNRESAVQSCEKAVSLDPGQTRAFEILRMLRPS